MNQRDWGIYHALTQWLIARARALYAQESSALELDASVCALGAPTIDLCLSLFDWAPFRSTKAAIKLHTLLDLRGAIPAFIYISDGKLHDVNVLDMLTFEAGAFYVMDRGYVDFSRLYTLHQAGAFFVTRAKSPMDARRVYSAAVDRATGVICDQRVMLQRLSCIDMHDSLWTTFENAFRSSHRGGQNRAPSSSMRLGAGTLINGQLEGQSTTTTQAQRAESCWQRMFPASPVLP